MNSRVVLTGVLRVVLALAFFFGMGISLAAKSSDPAAMMQTVGTVSGAVGGIGIVMVLVGAALRRKR